MLGARGFDFRMCNWKIFIEYSIMPHCGCGVNCASNRNDYREYFLQVKTAGEWDLQNNHLHVATVFKSGCLKLLETSGTVQVCNGIAVTFTLFSRYCSFTTTQKQGNQTPATSKRVDRPRRSNCNRKDKKCRCSANCGRPLCLCVFRNKRHNALCTTFRFFSLSVIQELCRHCCVCETWQMVGIQTKTCYMRCI